jgi:hypothetical protein
MERVLYLDNKIFGLKDFSKKEIMVKADFPGAQMVSHFILSDGFSQSVY